MHTLKFGKAWRWFLVLASVFGGALRAETPGDGVAALEAVASRFTSLDAFLKDKEARREYEALLSKYLERDRFPCDGFNEVMDQMRAWMDADPTVAEKLWAPQKAWQFEVPIKRASAKAPEKYRFVSSPRRFHGIWLDMSGAGCSEGVCAPLNMRAPGRWAAGLDGSVVFHLEKGSRYTGTSLLLSEVDMGAKRLRLISSTEDALLREPGHVFEKKKGKRKTTLLAEWAKAVHSKKPLAVIEGSDHVYGVAGHHDLGELSTMSFHDPRAQKLMPLLSAKCLSAQKAAAKVGSEEALAMKPAGGGSQASGSAGAGAASVPPALQSVLLALQLPPGMAAAAATPAGTQKSGELEKALGEKLGKSPEAKQRALAALALGLLGQEEEPRSVVGNGNGPRPPNSDRDSDRDSDRYPGRKRPPHRFDERYSPQARSALSRALRDPSPPVRVQAAFAIANAGGTRFSPTIVNMPRELVVIQPPLQQALREAATSPRLAAFDAPPQARAFTSPEGIRDQGISNMIREGLPLGPEIKKDMFDRAQNGSTAEIREQGLAEIARDYTQNTTATGAMDAVKTLEDELKKRGPDFQKLVVKKIDEDFLKNCDECNDKNIIRPGTLSKVDKDGNVRDQKNASRGDQ